jgi:hypothetical protein
MNPFRRILPCITGVLVASVIQLQSGPGARAKEPALSTKPERLVIHEWGTFTCLQDEMGEAVPGVNTDDEPVPQFVHRITDLVPRPSELAPVYYKGVPRSHRQVRMRLETPVVYFHPPANQRQPLHASLQVDFRGGWLTEYYPKAKISATGLQEANFRFAGLTPQTRGTLDWHDLTIGGDYPLPETDAQVWLAPRAVDAATIKAPGGEAEKYLFYRGVGNLASPITVTRTAGNDGLIVREDVPPPLGLRAPLAIRALWLVHVRQDGQVAYRSLGSVQLTGDSGHELLRTPLAFADERPAKSDRPVNKDPANKDPANKDPVNKDKDFDPDADRGEIVVGRYSGGNLARLRSEMREVLIADGLFQDEAEAMLRTWELAYFKSAGLRLFYLLPQQWTEAVLPMKCSLVADVSRTMVGRIELVTPQQRALIKKIGAADIAQINWFFQQRQERPQLNEQLANLWEGKVRFQDLKIDVPREYQAYLDLGRFRNALILEEFTRRPNSGLRRFVDAYHLAYYTADEGPDFGETAAAK